MTLSSVSEEEAGTASYLGESEYAETMTARLMRWYWRYMRPGHAFLAMYARVVVIMPLLSGMLSALVWYLRRPRLFLSSALRSN
jgi:hypothetical protein